MGPSIVVGPFFLTYKKKNKMALEIEELNDSEGSEKKQTPSIDQTELLEQMRLEIKKLQEQQSQPANSGGNIDVVSALTLLAEQLKQKPDSEKYGGANFYVKPEDIDQDDLIVDGVPFFCHQVYYVIVDDVRQGFPVKTPFGNVITFQYQSTKRVSSGNETRLHNLSVYVSYSKKEVAWLEGHRGYGSIFFKNHVAAMSIDSRKAAKLARIMAVLQRYDVAKVVKMANANGISPSTDINTLRLVLANKQADEEMKTEEASNQIRVKEALIEADILKEEK